VYFNNLEEELEAVNPSLAAAELNFDTITSDPTNPALLQLYVAIVIASLDPISIVIQ